MNIEEIKAREQETQDTAKKLYKRASNPNVARLVFINDKELELIRRVASGELIEVKHGHIVNHHRHMGGYKYANCPECNTEIEIQCPVEGDEPYCSECGTQLAESFQDRCPRCGAILDGKDDSHETD